MALAVTPDDFVKAVRARDRAAINQAAARLLEQRTPLGEQWFSVAHVLVRNGEIALAVEAANRAVEECAGSAKARFHLALVLASVGRQEEAIATMSAIDPNELPPTDSNHLLGTWAMELGDFDRAREAFDRALAASPGHGPSWLSLSALPPADDADLLRRLDGAASAVQAGRSDSQAQWHYAKGTVLDRLGRFEEAFEAFSAGAELVRPARAYDPTADLSEAEALIADFGRAKVERIARQVTAESHRPILVTGLPRSGTTLVEQILASHSQVAGGGELPFGSILAREIGGNSLARLDSFVSAHGADRLTRLYLHLGDEQFGEGQRFVDKCLGNNRALGVLASVLPQAPVLWLRRDPLDCAWSCYRTYFSEGIEWSWSLTDIAAHFRAEELLHAHWQDVLGERLLTVSYEALAADPNDHIARILAHCGLPAETATDAAHQTRRAVTTASVAQVRRPVNQSSVGAAHPYREQLAPFAEAYGK